jgi:hypothetical protein
MKDKVKIIYLTSFVMTKFKWFIKELNYLEKNSDIEVHELCDFLFPKARKTLPLTFESKNIFKFKNFSDWKKNILRSKKKCISEGDKLVILTELSQYPAQGYNLKYLMVNRFLKQTKLDYYEFNVNGHIPPKASSRNYFRYIKIFKYWRYILARLNELLTRFLANMLNLKPKGIFVAGNQVKRKIMNLKKSKGIELINLSTWEFSSTISKKNNSTNLFNNKYAVFVNKVGPNKKTSDEIINNSTSPETAEKWYPSLNSFFSFLEKVFNLKIVIASHPKSNEEGHLSYLDNRVSVLNQTEELIKGSEFVIGRNSTALGFAVIYKKPILFIHSNETKKNVSRLNEINNFSNYFKTKSVNIDDDINDKEIKSLISFDHQLYESYMNDFLTSSSKNQNYKIILEYLNKLSFK